MAIHHKNIFINLNSFSFMRKCILVLGMHRTGTSAMAGVLKILGIDFGTDLMGGNKENIKGYFEQNKIVEINDKILHELGSSWDDVKPLKKGWHKLKKLSVYKKKIKNVLEKEFGIQKIFWA
ncbi:hypothetical protein ES705_06696 [subsurface metagenome]